MVESMIWVLRLRWWPLRNEFLHPLCLPDQRVPGPHFVPPAVVGHLQPPRSPIMAGYRQAKAVRTWQGAVMDAALISAQFHVPARGFGWSNPDLFIARSVSGLSREALHAVSAARLYMLLPSSRVSTTSNSRSLACCSRRAFNNSNRVSAELHTRLTIALILALLAANSLLLPHHVDLTTTSPLCPQHRAYRLSCV
jgi:hypothetical protein